MKKIFETLDKNYIKFENSIIDVIINDNGELWFNAKQCALALGYSDTKQAIKNNVDNDDKIQLHKINKYAKIYMGHPHTLFLSEEGMYDLIVLSKMKKAKKFRKWITHEVLPSIRKYGYYKLKKEYENEKTEIIKKINYLEQQNKIMKYELKKEKFPTGGIVYVIDYSSSDQKAYRIGMSANMTKRKKNYDTHTLQKHKVIFMKKTKCPIRLETCIRAMLYEYRYKNKKDFFICNLTIIKKAFMTCLKSMNCVDKQKGGSKTVKKNNYKTIIDKILNSNKNKNILITQKIAKLNKKLYRNDVW